MDEDVKAGQAAYTPLTLKVYDWFVLGFSNRYLWRCPTSELEALYDRNVSAHHLDIGVRHRLFPGQGVVGPPARPISPWSISMRIV